MSHAGLYVHFPFCRAKCPYCHFASVPFAEEPFLSWWEGTKREASLRSSLDLGFDTLYVGGGTPSLIGPADLFALRELLAGRLRLEIAEFSLEANPGASDVEVLRGWKEAGVTRLSIGVQSFDDDVLVVLGRGYSADEAREFFDDARRSEFETVALDLMIGVPGQTRQSALQDLDAVRELGPDHVSVYILENVEGLPFEKILERRPVAEETTVGNFAVLRDGLEDIGLAQYEIANFARQGKECRHNLKYWRYEPFLGLGPSACSHIDEKRWGNVESLEEWAGRLEEGEEPLGEVVDLTPEARVREALVFGLRLVEGIGLEDFKTRHGVDLRERLAREWAGLEAEGLLVMEKGRLRIPRDRFLISNSVFANLV